MGVTRHFLDWQEPLTDLVCRWLLPSDAPLVDLEGTLVVVPGRQAGRRLREAVARETGRRGGAVLSLRVATPSLLIDPPEARGADEADASTVLAAWARVLRADDLADRAALFPSLPEPRDFAWAMGMVPLLENVRAELADAGYTVGDFVRQHADDLPELDRWRDLAVIDDAYARALASAGRRDPVAARVERAARADPPNGATRIVLAAVPEPPPLAVRLLGRWAGAIRVEILVHAPAERAGEFDGWGRPDPAAWATAEIPIPAPERTLRVVASPGAQADEVIRTLAEEAKRFGPGDAAIGVPDETVTPPLEDRLNTLGIAAFDPARCRMDRHTLYRLVDSFLGLGDHNGYPSLAALLRHPDVLKRLHRADRTRPSVLLTELDEFQNTHLPPGFDDVRAQFPDGRYGASRGPEARFAALAAALAWLAPHVEALRRGPAADAVRAFLREVYAGRALREGEAGDDLFQAAAEVVDEALHEGAQAAALFPELDVVEQAHLLRRRLADASLDPEPPAGAIDLQGWLELPWNDEPLLVVTGMNEGVVPAAAGQDSFLPDSLRERLGLHGDAERMARDAFLLSGMLASRADRGRVVLVSGRTRADGEPLRPSRLLLRCPDDELPVRAASLFAEVADPRRAYPFQVSFALRPDRPGRPGAAVPSVSRLSVTALRDYLDCPFRFYLKHVLRMEALDDLKDEPDALDFGLLVHHAFEEMARDAALSRSTDAEAIGACLEEAAEAWVRRRYGANPALTVLVTLDGARQRLRRAARVQAGLAAAGWEIVTAEPRRETDLGGLTLVGRIDRVDRHRESGRVRVIDYKTADRVTLPDEAHVASARPETPAFARFERGGKERRWKDLQLPLYRVLLGAAADDGLELAYFNLPKAVAGTALNVWTEFDVALAASAETCAREIVRRIRAGVFWPPAQRIDHPEWDPFRGLWFGDVAESFRVPNGLLDGGKGEGA